MQTPDLAERRLALVRLHMKAENVHDFDKVIATFSRPRYELIGSGQTHDGESEVRAYFQATRTAFPDQRNELIALHCAADAVIAEFDLLGTHLGPLSTPTGDLPPTGRTFRARCCAVFAFEGEKIVAERVYFDRLTILSQLTGAP
ncbi:MAG: ester cyclase [Parvularculaceae bacterium]